MEEKKTSSGRTIEGNGIVVSDDGGIVIKGVTINSLPTTTSGTITSSSTWPTTLEVKPAPAPEPEPEKPKKIIAFPTRVTRKVVIGFIEDDDTVVWSAKVQLLDFTLDLQDGEGRISLVTGVEDADESE